MTEEIFEQKQKELNQLLEERNYPAIQASLMEEEAVDIAELFEELGEQNLALVFRILPKDLASEVFVHFSNKTQELLLLAYSDEEISEVVAGLYNDDLVEILEELPASVAKRVLSRTDPERRKLVNRLLQYEDGSAGSIMTTEYMRLEARMTVKEALHKLRTIKTRVEMIYTCFVTTSDRILEGVISVADLLRAADEEKVADIMEADPHFVITSEEQGEVSNLFQRYDLLALPVLDHEERLVGIITVDDALDVLVQETSEDQSHMAAVQATSTPYLETSVLDNVKRRLFWLMLLMLSGTLNAFVLQFYEPVYVALPVLVALMPMLTSTGGNAASQTNSVTIVAMSMDEISERDAFRVLWKEFRVGLICGFILALANGGFVYLRFGRDARLALCIFVSFFITIIVSKCLAAALPFLARAVKLDPAMVVSPLITTIIDILSLFIYYGTAARLFKLG